MKAKIFSYFIIIVIIALLKIQILQDLIWNHKIWQHSVSLPFSSLPTGFYIVFKTETAPLIWSFFINSNSNKVRMYTMDCTRRFKN